MDLSDPVKAFTAVGTALAGPGRRRVVLVDDLHLLDAASAVLLRQLMDSGAIRLLATVRTGEPVNDAVQALAYGERVDRIDLADLSFAQVERLLCASLGGPVGRRSVHELYVTSGGNALYLRELVIGALSSGDLASDGEVWELVEARPPRTAQLTELIAARLRGADATGVPVLELLSMCEPLSLADAQQVAPLEALVDLERQGLIQTIQSKRRTTVALAHPLYGEVLRAGLSAPRRRGILLKQIERTTAWGARRREDPLQVATWTLAASGTADPPLLVRAATLARHAYDYPQTIALLRALPEAFHTVTTRLMLAEALFQAGNWDDVDIMLADVHRTVIREQDDFAVTLLRTRSLLWGHAGASKALAVNGAALSRATDASCRRSLEMNEGFLRIAAGEPMRGLTLLEEMETDPAQATDISAWLRCALLKATGLALTGRGLAALALSERAHGAHLHVNEFTLVSPPAIQRIPLTLALGETGRLAEARTAGRSAFSDLAASSTFKRVWIALVAARVEWLAGRAATARHWFAEATGLARTIDYPMALRPALSGLAACAAVLGDLNAAQTALDQQRNTPAAPPGFLSTSEESLGEAWLQAAYGHTDEARIILIEAAATAQQTGYFASEAMLLTDAARLGGAKDVATRLCELVEVCEGPFSPARAHLAGALASDYPERLIAAADELEYLGAELLAAEAATQAAAVWRRTGQARKAAAAANQAARAGRHCEGARTPLLATTEVTVPLTAREREIALLAAADTPSKDIACALSLSIRTVDNHLQHAYTKLGVTTRNGLADKLGVKGHALARGRVGT
ncbi:LuxR C-terminal-related transcriptional regulator [Streptomyces sp. NBC_00289]